VSLTSVCSLVYNLTLSHRLFSSLSLHPNLFIEEQNSEIARNFEPVTFKVYLNEENAS